MSLDAHPSSCMLSANAAIFKFVIYVHVACYDGASTVLAVQAVAEHFASAVNSTSIANLNAEKQYIQNTGKSISGHWLQ